MLDLGCEWVRNNFYNLDYLMLVMVDGFLIYWFLEFLFFEVWDRVLYLILDVWNKLKLVGIFLMGYLSVFCSNESLFFLCLKVCIFDEFNCVSNCLNVGLGGFGFIEKVFC